MFDHIVLNGNVESEVAIIWLHPSGGNMLTEHPVIRWLNTDGVRVFVPEGPFWHGSSQRSRVWYHQVKDDFVEDNLVYASLVAMRKFVNHIRNAHGIKKIVLAGFSNGGSFAAMCGIMLPDLFDYVIDFAGYIPRTEDYLTFLGGDHTVREYLREKRKDNPLRISVHHGTNDLVNEYPVTLRNVEEIQIVEGLDVGLITHAQGHYVTDAGLTELERVAQSLRA